MIQIIKYTGKMPYGCKLRGAGAKNKRRKKRYKDFLSMRKEAKDVLKHLFLDLETSCGVKK